MLIIEIVGLALANGFSSVQTDNGETLCGA